MTDFPQPPKPRWGRGDIYGAPLEALSWKPADREAALASLFDHVRKDALEVVNWYAKAKRPKRRAAIVARLLAITAAGIAALLPLLDGIVDPTTAWSSLWVSLALAIGAGLIAFDRYLGWSTGWIRYIKSELQVRDTLEIFELEWQADRATWQGEVPSVEQVARLLSATKAFVGRINAVVQEETNAWAEEFMGALQQIEDALKARDAEAKAREVAGKAEAVADKPGALNLEITNGEQSANGWKLQIDDGPESQRSGKTAAVANLSPGSHAVRVRGSIGGKDVVAERVVDIAANTALPLSMTLT